jgi:CrcB protein
MLFAIAVLGAAVGAPARWLVDQWVQSRHDSVFPWGTLVVNVVGSLILGTLLALVATGRASEGTLALAGVGFCGGFTTFSTFGYETVRLMQDGSRLEAVANVGLSLAAGLLAAFAGWYAVIWIGG